MRALKGMEEREGGERENDDFVTERVELIYERFFSAKGE